MTLIQNEDNKCPTTKQVNDALESIGGGVQTLVLTTQDLISTDRSSPLEVNSSDQAVMDTVKSNAEKNIPFQLLYYRVTSGISSVQLLPVSLYGIPVANVFTLYVNVNQSGLQYFSLNKGSNQKWTASTLSNS
jgi:hypothetical protein